MTQPIVNHVSWRIGGQQGEGIDSTGDIFAKAVARSGLHLYTFRSFSSRIRGGLTFFGHTHLQGGFFFRRATVKGIDKVPSKWDELTISIDDHSSFLINPGSVGQPRDGDWRAAYAVYEAEDRLVTYYRVEYDAQEARRRMREAGLPAILGDRLLVGK